MKSGVHLARVWRLAGLLVTLLLLSGCDVAQPAGITIQVAPYKIPINTPELMCGAPLVLDARITALLPGHWNTPTGARPTNVDPDPQKLLEGGYAIYTPLQFSSVHIYIDNRKQATSEFAILGGQVGADQYIANEMTSLVAAGKAYLMVLLPGVDQTHARTEKLMVVQEAFPIDEQGIVTLEEAHSEGKGADSQEVPAVTRPLSEFVDGLANCK